jgi:predicted nucleic acid-binding protein
MIHGLDTSFLVALELADHPNHAAAQQQLARLLADSDEIALAPQVLTEFIHIVTDGRRFVRPLDMTAANRAAIEWWMSQHTFRVFPDERSTLQFLA